MWENYQSVASCTSSTGDLAHNPGMCPDWELNWQPFGLQAGSQYNEPHLPGLFLLLIHLGVVLYESKASKKTQWKRKIIIRILNCYWWGWALFISPSSQYLIFYFFKWGYLYTYQWSLIFHIFKISTKSILLVIFPSLIFLPELSPAPHPCTENTSSFWKIPFYWIPFVLLVCFSYTPWVFLYICHFSLSACYLIKV